MKNKEIIETLLVSGKLACNVIDTEGNLNKYYLNKICESDIELTELILLAVDEIIYYDTFILLGCTLVSNLKNKEECEKFANKTAYLLRLIYKHLNANKEKVNMIAFKIHYEISFKVYNDIVEAERILKRASIVDLVKSDELVLDNKLYKVDNVPISAYGINHLQIEKLGCVQLIIIKDNKVSIFEDRDIQDKSDRYALIANMIANDDFDIIFQGKIAGDDMLDKIIENKIR